MNKRDSRSGDIEKTRYFSRYYLEHWTKEDHQPTFHLLFRVSTLRNEVPRGEKTYPSYRTRKWHRRIRVLDTTEYRINKILEQITRLSSDMDITDDIRKNAVDIYMEALAKDLIRGIDIEIVSAAALYAGCRRTDSCRISLTDFKDHSSVSEKQIERTYRYLSKELDIKSLPPSPDEYIDNFCNELDLPLHTKKTCETILEEASKSGITSGKGPSGMAAASIYISSLLEDKPRTQKDIAEVAGVTEVTIRNRYKELVNKLDIDINGKKER